MNRTIFQFFHWYYSTEGNLWNHCADQAKKLAELGITDVWLPPAYKSARGIDEPGYAVYDLYDLGEFDQKGSVRTRYGTKDELLACIRALHDRNISVLADIVLNHKHGGDEKERFPVVNVNSDNRLEVISEPYEAEAETRFTFPGRNGKYSDYIWDWHSFTGVCTNDTIQLIQNEYSKEGWERLLEWEKGNYDFLMCNDIEFRNPYVREELKRWGKWFVETTGIDGFRLDALKHITPDFYLEWLEYLNHHFNKPFFCIGEYWQNNIEALTKYITATGKKIQLFDVPLHFNFHEASLKKAEFDLRTIFDNTLIQRIPELAISFVDNHDTQPLQSLQSPVEPWFKPLAYALILLREQGIPCVFYPAVYEAKYCDKTQEGQEVYVELQKIDLVEKMMQVRKYLAYGHQSDHFDSPKIIGWTRQGTDEMADSGCAVLLSNDEGGDLKMNMGVRNANKRMVDISGCHTDNVILDENGTGVFKVNPVSVSVWVHEGSI